MGKAWGMSAWIALGAATTTSGAASSRDFGTSRQPGGSSGGGAGTGASMSAAEREPPAAQTIMGPEAPDDLPRRTVVTLSRENRPLSMELDATMLAFAGLASFADGSKKK